MTVGVSEWLELLRREYLEDFVREGGAGVKFALVPDALTASDVLGRVRRATQDAGFVLAQVDARVTRVHLMQHLFCEVARQIDWEDLARRVVRRCYEDQGLQIPETGSLVVETVAAYNRVDAAPLLAELRRDMHTLLQRSHDLARDFRYAMLWLCMAELGKGIGDKQVILEWLRGDLRLVSAMKSLLIFQKIGRHNARAMLSSLSAWCRLAGLSGLVLILDIRQLAVGRRSEAEPGTLHYSNPAAMDTYEVLRQLIDNTDDLTGFLSLVMAGPELFEDEKRGVKAYKALYERVWPDVRLKSRPNPLSALTALGRES